MEKTQKRGGSDQANMHIAKGRTTDGNTTDPEIPTGAGEQVMGEREQHATKEEKGGVSVSRVTGCFCETRDTPANPDYKFAVLKCCLSVVGIVSGPLPPEMTRYRNQRRMKFLASNQVFMGSGFVIECEDLGNNEFSCIVLTSANLFKGIPEPEVDVYHANGYIYTAELLVTDFHYNLAALKFNCATPMQTASVKYLDHSMSFHPNAQNSQLLRPHSSLFSVRAGDTVIAVGRRPMASLLVTQGHFSVVYQNRLDRVDCKEVYSIGIQHKGDRGGPAVNCNGEVIGMMVENEFFLPSNLVSRWWNSYKEHGRIFRPWTGMEIINLRDASYEILEPLLLKFPTVSSGVVITKVLDTSAAYHCGLCAEDIIVQCDGALVQSTLEFFERIWDKAGQSVVLTVVRLSRGEYMNLTMAVDEATLDNFYKWSTPYWWSRPVLDKSDSETMDETSK